MADTQGKKKTIKKKKKAPLPEARKEEERGKERKARKILRLHNLGAGILFLVIGGAMLLFTGYLLWQRVFAPPALGKVIPDGDLVFLAELETLQGVETLRQKVPPAADAFEYWQNWLFQNDLNGPRKQYLGKRGGIAAYRYAEGTEPGETMFITFAELTKQRELENDLKARSEVSADELSGFPLYAFLTPAERYCLLFKGYMACSAKRTTLEKLVENLETNGTSVADSSDFQAVTAELPRTFIGRLFIRSAPFLESFGTLPSAKPFLPLAETLGSVGLSLTEARAGEELGASVVLMRRKLAPEKDIENEVVNFSGELPTLLTFMPQEATGFLWGNDFAEDLIRGFTELSRVDPGFEKNLRAIFRQEVEEVFGSTLSWEEDILPLLEGEFLVGTHRGRTYLILDTKDAEFAAAKEEKLRRAIQYAAGEFLPEIVSHTLSNGNTVEEIFPNAESLQAETRTENGADIFTLEAQNSSGLLVLSLALARKDTLLLFATPATAIEDILDGEGKAGIAKDLPVRFAGPSEEVFGVSSALFENFWAPELFGKATPFLSAAKRLSGKVVNTPRFFRLEGHAEF